MSTLAAATRRFAALLKASDVEEDPGALNALAGVLTLWESSAPWAKRDDVDEGEGEGEGASSSSSSSPPLRECWVDALRAAAVGGVASRRALLDLLARRAAGEASVVVVAEEPDKEEEGGDDDDEDWGDGWGDVDVDAPEVAAVAPVPAAAGKRNAACLVSETDARDLVAAVTSSGDVITAAKVALLLPYDSVRSDAIAAAAAIVAEDPSAYDLALSTSLLRADFFSSSKAKPFGGGGDRGGASSDSAARAAPRGGAGVGVRPARALNDAPLPDRLARGARRQRRRGGGGDARRARPRGAFTSTPVPIRPRSRGERRSLRTFSPVVRHSPPRVPRWSQSLHAATPFNSASDAFQLNPDVRRFARTLDPQALRTPEACVFLLERYLRAHARGAALPPGVDVERDVDAMEDAVVRYAMKGVIEGVRARAADGLSALLADLR